MFVSANGHFSHLLEDAERQMRDARGIYHPRAFQFDGCTPQMVEQSNIPYEQDGHQVPLILAEGE
jgi:hypothetical protein